MYRSASVSSPRISAPRAARSRAPAVLEALETRELLSAAPTSTALDASAHSTVYGQAVTLTAFVSGGGTGDVSFFNDGAPIGAAALQPNGQAKLFTAALPVGSHAITASYAGDADHAASASPPITQTISRSLTTTLLNSSNGVVINPVLTPDRVVVVMEENSFSNAIGDTVNMPYVNQLAASGLVYDNSHGLNGSEQVFGQMNYLALYSGSTQGITDDFSGYSFSGPNLAHSLHGAGLSFGGFVEALPYAGDVTDFFAADPSSPANTDAYARRYNPMAQFTDVGAGKTNADVNRPFTSFPTDYSALPTVSYVIPDRLHNTHGSNEAPPFSGDPAVYDPLRHDADAWLEQNLGGYVEWARTHNSLLIVQTEDGDRARNYAAGGTTIVAGDPRLFTAGVNSTYVTHYNLLRTIEHMYGLAPLGDTASASQLDTDAQGRLTPAGPAATTLRAGQGVTYTASVLALAPGAGTLGGAVQFLVDGSALGAAMPLTNGTATLSPGNLFAGDHRITASYLGDPSFEASRSTLSQAVLQAPTSVALSSSAATSSAGQPVVLTASVIGGAGGLSPSGIVTFIDGPSVLGTAPVGPDAKATFSTSGLSVGPHSITASYGGDASFAASDSPTFAQTINANSSSVSLASSAPSAAVGQSVVFTATVLPASVGALRPGGSVTFFDGPTRLGSAALDAAGRATLATAALAAGSHAISAVYSGDANFASSVSAVLTQLVVAAPTKPANDNFADRITLSGPSVSTTGSNVGAGKEAGEPKHGGNVGGHSVWWTWTAPSSGIVTIDTAGSAFRTVIGVYTGTKLASLDRVPGIALTIGGASTFTFLAAKGKTYQLAVDGFDGASGAVKLRLRTWALPPRLKGEIDASSVVRSFAGDDESPAVKTKTKKAGKRSARTAGGAR